MIWILIWAVFIFMVFMIISSSIKVLKFREEIKELCKEHGFILETMMDISLSSYPWILGKDFKDFIKDRPELDKQIREILEERHAFSRNIFSKAAGLMLIAFILGIITAVMQSL